VGVWASGAGAGASGERAGSEARGRAGFKGCASVQSSGAGAGQQCPLPITARTGCTESVRQRRSYFKNIVSVTIAITACVFERGLNYSFIINA
jgi:hypothetical protein